MLVVYFHLNRTMSLLTAYLRRKFNQLIMLCRWSRRVRNLIFILPLTIFAFFIFQNYVMLDRVESQFYLNVKSLRSSPLDQQENEKLACEIPKLDPFNPTILELMTKEEESLNSLDCTVKYPVWFDSLVDDPPRLVPVSDNLTEVMDSCCYRNLISEETTCFPVSLENDTVIPKEHEFISIECSEKSEDGQARTKKIVDVHPFVHKKTKVMMRVEKRKEMIRRIKMGDSQEDKLNVIVLGLESMSRMNFQRTMTKTRSYLKTVLKAVEMEGFNKIADNTVGNIGPLLTNLPVAANNEVRLSCVIGSKSNFSTAEWCPFIWKKYADSGYHTLYAEDQVSNNMAVFNELKLSTTKSTSKPDYYFPDFGTAVDKLVDHGYEKRGSCYGPRTSFQSMLDYMKKMSVAMGPSENYLQFVWSSSLTHGKLNGGKLADEDLKSALEWLWEGGYLDNTVLILISDHGAKFGEIQNLYQGQLEARLPFMYVMVPSNFRQLYPLAYRNLVSNRNRLITPWDVYETLHHLLEPKHLEDQVLSLMHQKVALERLALSESLGTSLFYPVPLSRTCKSAGVPINYCTCNHRMESVWPLDPLAIQAATHVVQVINSKLATSSTKNLCAYLYLDKVIQAGKVSFGDVSSSSSWKGYQISFATQPGSATFEALVVHVHESKNPVVPGEEWNVAGNILRTNFDQNQTWCLNGNDDDDRDDKFNKVQIYCYCLPKNLKNKTS